MIYYMPPTPNNIWEDKAKHSKFWSQHKLFCKN